MTNQVDVIVRRKRYDVLNLLNNRKKAAYVTSQVHRILEIVVEDEDPYQYIVGTSGNYLKIKVHGKLYPKKSLVTVSIAERAGDALIGIPVEKL